MSSAVEEREGLFRPVEALLKPSIVALVGASDSSRGGWAQEIYDNLEYSQFPTKLYLINPKRNKLWGRAVYPNFAALPEPVDLALTVIPAPHIPDTLAEGVEHGLKGALIYAAQFGEGNDEVGAKRAQDIRALCDSRGLRVTGPNCMGALALRERLLFYPSKRVRGLRSGSVGVIFQSGGTFQFWLQQASQRGLGFSYAVSSGNELDLDLADYINFLVEDEHTKVIACMVEGVRRPQAFMAVAAKALAAGKPILLVKVGKSVRAQIAAASHTGAVAGDDAIFDAVCHKYGIVRCHSLDDLIESCLVFNQGRLPRGPRVAMVGFSGGAKGLFLDYAAEEEVQLASLSPDVSHALSGLIDAGLPAENPLDAGASVATMRDKFADICRVVSSDPNVDLMIVQGTLPVEPTDPYETQSIANWVSGTDKPVLSFGRVAQNVSEISRNFQEETCLPHIQGLPETTRALKGLIRYAKVRKSRIELASKTTSRQEGIQITIDEFYKLLDEHGMTMPRSAFVKAAEDAAKIAGEVGYPVAVKLVSPQALHKTEVGGVSLNLKDSASVQAAAELMAARLIKSAPDAVIDGFLVQEMVDGLELIVGVRQDPHYGPFMLVGLGGIFVEALKDVAIRLLPINESDAVDMLDSIRAKVMFETFRGRPARDMKAVARAMAGLSQLFMEHQRSLSDLEINPLVVLAAGQGVRAVDVRTILRAPGGKV